MNVTESKMALSLEVLEFRSRNSRRPVLDALHLVRRCRNATRPVPLPGWETGAGEPARVLSS